EVAQRVNEPADAGDRDDALGHRPQVLPAVLRQAQPPQVAAPRRQAAAVLVLTLLVHRGEVQVPVRGLDDARVDLHLPLAVAVNAAALQGRNHVAAVEHPAGVGVVLEQVGRGDVHVPGAGAGPDVPADVAAGSAPDGVGAG